MKLNIDDGIMVIIMTNILKVLKMIF